MAAPPRRRRGVLTITAGSLLLIVFLVSLFVSSDDPLLDRADKLSSVFSAIVGLLSLAVGVAALRGAEVGTAPANLRRDALRALSAAVSTQWSEELAVDGLADERFAVQVGWERADDALGVPDETLTAGRVTAVRLSGHFAEIGERFAALPRRQLVLLGAGGAGKTTMALRLTLDLIARRADDDPVPVVISLTSWKPRIEAAEDWLAEQLRRAHPALSRPYGDHGDLAAHLVIGGHILPVLDGLDELPRTLRAVAIERINSSRLATRPLVLTSRTAAYTEAEKDAGAYLAAAAVVQLLDLTAEDTAAYLAARGHPRERWRPVVDHLRARPHGVLASALRTPLFAWLYHTVHSGRQAQPALYDGAGGPQPHRVVEVQRGLLAGLVPSVYAQARPTDAAYRTYPVDTATRWLTFTARLGQRLGGNIIPWWGLRAVLPAPLRLMHQWVKYPLSAAAALVGWQHSMTAAFVAGLGCVILVEACLDQAHRLAPSIRPRQANLMLSVRRALDLVDRLVVGVLLGSLLGFIGGFAVGFVTVLGTAVVGPLVGDAPEWIHRELAWGIPYWLAAATVLGVPVGAVTGLVAGFLGWVNVPVDEIRAADPVSTLGRDRGAAIVTTVAYVLTLSTIGAGAGSLIDQWVAGLLVGAATGLYVGLHSTAWAWYQVARCWLALRGRLPWRPLVFFEDARRRKILRRIGTSYQFRHVYIKDTLLNPTSTAPPTQGPDAAGSTAGE